MADDRNHVYIFDTTLRDGEQALMRSLTPVQKLQLAMMLDELGVDVIEAGFPISSPGDLKSVHDIGHSLKNAVCCGLSRTVEKDIDAVNEALHGLDHFRIHTFVATSDIHVKDKLHRSFDDIIAMCDYHVRYARNYTDDVEFSCEDAGRTPIDHLCRIVETAIKAGATTVNIPDTVGFTLPYEFGGIIKTLFNRVPNIDKARISVHCHNDLGMATANSLTAVQEGARQIEVCMNGLGERAGNCSLEEVVMTMKLREKYMGGVYTNVVAENIARASQMVANVTNEPVPSHKAVVGSNAFTHSSGIHQDGVLKNKQTYEILTPESVGFKENNMHMTARSGRHMIKAVLEKLGYKEGTYNLDEIYQRFLKLADRKGQVFDYDLEALMFFTNDKEEESQFKLDNLSVMSGADNIIPTASVRLRIGKRTRTESGTGNGPVDAVFNCINRLTGIKLKLESFQITAKGSGMNAQGQVNVDVIFEGRHYYGVGISTDVIEASALSLISASNSIYRAQMIEQEKEQDQGKKE